MAMVLSKSLGRRLFRAAWAASYGGRRGGAILQMDAGFACLALCGGAAFNGVDRACSKLRSVIEAKRLDENRSCPEEARRRGVSP
jgi:hypothetical protein